MVQKSYNSIQSYQLRFHPYTSFHRGKDPWALQTIFSLPTDSSVSATLSRDIPIWGARGLVQQFGRLYGPFSLVGLLGLWHLSGWTGAEKPLDSEGSTLV